MKVFIGTNVWASGLAATGLCADLLDFVQQRHQAVVSPTVLRELPKALRRLGLEEDVVQAACFVTQDVCQGVPEPAKAERRSRDPKDDLVLQAALDADCDWLVSGDKDLTSLKRVQRMPITTPRDFLEALGVVDPY